MSSGVRPTVPGWVYVLASQSKPGIVKIGRTTRNAIGRARELERSEGYAAFGPWTEAWSCAVSDSGHVETAAHRMLAHHRIRLGRVQCRELFWVDLEEACRVVEAAAGSLRGRIVMTQPRPRRFRPSKRLRFGSRITRRLTRALAALAFCLTLVWLLTQ